VKNLITEVSGNGALKLAIAAGTTGSLLGFLNSNAAAIGILLSAFFGITSLLISWHKNNQSADNAKEIQELKDTIKSISSRKNRKLK
tara:strand:+ start:7505 stop:7765 length:261 start_codon:yes stop_codon:yes gene_type:complete